MENASKALIIAGAILLSIVIISLGLVVVQNTRGTINSANVDKQAAQVFNGQWEEYQGSGKTASEIVRMFNDVIVSNGTETKNATNRFVTITTAAAAPTARLATAPRLVVPTVASLNNARGYTVSLGVDPNTGYVVGISYTPTR